MTFISIEHASNYKKNNGLHLISCNSGHRCVFFIQGLNGLPNTRFKYSNSVRHIGNMVLINGREKVHGKKSNHSLLFVTHLQTHFCLQLLFIPQLEMCL